jgi:hypothetical protein
MRQTTLKLLGSLEYGKELSFHKIPKNPEIKKKWVQLLKRKGVRDPGPSHRVCSMHFVDGKKSYTTTLLQQSLPHAQPVNQERAQL